MRITVYQPTSTSIYMGARIYKIFPFFFGNMKIFFQAEESGIYKGRLDMKISIGIDTIDT